MARTAALPGGHKGIGPALPTMPPTAGAPRLTAWHRRGIDAEILRKAVKERFDILLAGGQDHLKGKVFRIRPPRFRLRP